jgi:hypothetical protein
VSARNTSSVVSGMSPKRLLVISLALLGGTATALVAGGTFAGAAAPSQCGGAISDVTGDGHHQREDIVSAYLGESNGKLQAVIKPLVGEFSPAHDDSETAGFAFLFTAGGQVHYVRAEAPRPPAAISYDYGIFNGGPGNRFTSQGTTTGETATGAGGSITIDIPAGTGAVPGAVLTNTFAMTWDGTVDDTPTGEPHWVDRGPGGTLPSEATFGADFVVGSCSGTTTTGTGTTGTGTTTGPARVTAVSLKATPKKFVGGGRVSVSGKVTPPMATPVDIAFKGRRTTTARVTSKPDGSFAVTGPVNEKLTVRATAGGIGSTTLSLAVQSTVKISISRTKNGGAKVSGQVKPILPGKVQLFRGSDFRSTAKTTTDSKGRFTITLKSPNPGKYQALFVPSGGRAERSNSNTGVIKK